MLNEEERANMEAIYDKSSEKMINNLKYKISREKWVIVSKMHIKRYIIKIPILSAFDTENPLLTFSIIF